MHYRIALVVAHARLPHSLSFRAVIRLESDKFIDKELIVSVYYLPSPSVDKLVTHLQAQTQAQALHRLDNQLTVLGSTT